jgi:peptide/nickel transport system substrate-binding protein
MFVRRGLIVLPGLDFDGADGGDPQTQLIWENVYEPLVYYPLTQKGTSLIPDLTRLEGRLAKSWTQDGLEWTFELNQGVKSPYGNELTADDVVWTVARAKSVSYTSTVTWFLYNAGGILGPAAVAPQATAADKALHGEVVKLDKYTVKFTQFEHSVLFPGVLAVTHLSILDSTEMKKHATTADPWAHGWMENQGAAGFGPDQISSWVKGSSIVLEANPNYYRPHPHFKKVTITAVPEPESRLTALEAGSADMAGSLAAAEYSQYAKSGNGLTYTWFGNGTTILVLNYNTEPWGGGGDAARARLLRQAIAYAIPYSLIIDKDYYGQAQQLTGEIAPSFVDATSYPGMYDLNLDKAKSLLSQAGYPGGKGLSGPGLTLNYAAERQSLLEPVATDIQTYLAMIGITITLAPIPEAQLDAGINVSKAIPFALYDDAFSLIPDAGYLLQGSYVTESVAGRSTAPNYSNPMVDKLWKESVSLTGQARANSLSQAQNILMQDLPTIPLIIQPTQAAARKGIVSWSPTMTEGTHFAYLTEA